MWPFSKFFGERKSFDEATWAALVDQGARTAAGIMVSPIRAMDCAAVAAAVRIRVETLGSLGLFLYRRGSDDERSRATDHPLYSLLHDRPNGWTSAAEFVMQIETDVIAEGAGFAYANRVRDRIVELIRLDPTSVTVKRDASGEPVYEVALSGGGTQRYGWRDILHVRGSIDFANRSEGRPLSALRQARQAIGLCMALEAHAARILGNGGRPSGVLTSSKTLGDVGHARLKKWWQSAHVGDASGGTAVLEDGVTFTPVAFSSVDLQFAEMRIFQCIEIGRALGVPPTLIFELGRATWSNSEEMAQSFKTFTLLGRCKLWQGAISRLLSPAEQVEYYPEFSVDSLVQADLAARYSAFAQACGGPFLTANEVRATDNRSSIIGGDELRPPANATGVEAKPAAKPKPVVVAA